MLTPISAVLTLAILIKDSFEAEGIEGRSSGRSAGSLRFLLAFLASLCYTLGFPFLILYKAFEVFNTPTSQIESQLRAKLKLNHALAEGDPDEMRKQGRRVGFTENNEKEKELQVVSKNEKRVSKAKRLRRGDRRRGIPVTPTVAADQSSYGMSPRRKGSDIQMDNGAPRNISFQVGESWI